MITAATAPAVVRLFQATSSSSSWRVRIALALKSVSYESVWIDLQKDDHLAEAYRLIAPTHQVPCLEIDGLRLFQSVAIIEYLEETRSQPPLLPHALGLRAQVRAIAELVNSGIQPLHNIAVRRRLGTQFAATETAAADWCRYWIERQFAALDQLLKETHGKFAFGDVPTIADVFLYAQVKSSERFAVQASDFPVLDAVVGNLAALSQFRDSHPPAA